MLPTVAGFRTQSSRRNAGISDRWFGAFMLSEQTHKRSPARRPLSYVQTDPFLSSALCVLVSAAHYIHAAHDLHPIGKGAQKLLKLADDYACRSLRRSVAILPGRLTCLLLSYSVRPDALQRRCRRTPSLGCFPCPIFLCLIYCTLSRAALSLTFSPPPPDKFLRIFITSSRLGGTGDELESPDTTCATTTTACSPTAAEVADVERLNRKLRACAELLQKENLEVRR